MPSLFDHALAALLLIVWPAWIAIHGRSGMREMAESPTKRLQGYMTTMIVQWAHFAAIIGCWMVLGRSWTDLGLGLDLGSGFVIAVALTIAIAWLMWNQWRRILRNPAGVERIRDQLREAEALVPKTQREVRAAQILSITAAICEELAYRGFVLWYLTAWMHVSLAIPLMALAFGVSHLYQGLRAAAQVVGIGIVAALLFLLSGSLWIPMVLHALLDLCQFALARAVLDSGPDPGAEPVGH